MDFDDVKRAWDECDHKLASSLRLNARSLRSIVTTQSDVSGNRPPAGDIDYTAPFVLVQKQLRSHRLIKIAQAVAASILDARRAGHLVTQFEAIVMRFLRRVRTLRS